VPAKTIELRSASGVCGATATPSFPTGSDPLALFDEQQVARNDLRGIDLDDNTGANHRRTLRERLRQGQDRPLGARLLPEAEDAVQEHDGGDRASFDLVPDRDRDDGGPDEQENERIEQLVEC
jgi:hypothetical protein